MVYTPIPFNKYFTLPLKELLLKNNLNESKNPYTDF